MIKVITSPNGLYAWRYPEYSERPMTNEERYEGWMRSDFANRKVPVLGSIREMIEVATGKVLYSIRVGN